MMERRAMQQNARALSQQTDSRNGLVGLTLRPWFVMHSQRGLRAESSCSAYWQRASSRRTGKKQCNNAAASLRIGWLAEATADCWLLVRSTLGLGKLQLGVFKAKF
mmetsp:Transcript_24618/g.38576  ORF Transcript_24618/g.38576 Transcript_24618/m.38576 type:complete len:106 (-) Transcript_24618:66-383(-)